MSNTTLIVDQAYQPLCLLPINEAVSRLAAAMEYGHGAVQALVSDETRVFRSQHLEIAAPLVMGGDIPAQYYHKLAWKETHTVSRRVLYARDRYTCQYCGWIADSNKTRQQLTLDHVKPSRLFRTRDDATTWENVVAACSDCNTKKAGFLPMECGMMPKKTPRQPHYVQLRFAGRLNELQKDYIRTFFSWNQDEVCF